MSDLNIVNPCEQYGTKANRDYNKNRKDNNHITEGLVHAEEITDVTYNKFHARSQSLNITQGKQGTTFPIKPGLL